MKKVMILGATGKMGTALKKAFGEGYEIVCKSSGDFNALDFKQVKSLIQEENPNIIFNAVAYLGIDPAEEDPITAFKLNTLYPKILAQESVELGALLVHFSTDSVFNGEKRDYYVESDRPEPLNLYGVTKYGGDCSIASIASKYYIVRVSILFGETSKVTQFVEKMLQMVWEGQKVLRISDDIVSSPTYSVDVATRIRHIIESSLSYGLYHVANAGKGTLYELISEIVKNLGVDVTVEKASYLDFPFIGRKNTNTPLASEKLETMRPWREAVSDYCSKLINEVK